MISTRNINLDEVDLDKIPQVKNVSGKDTKWTLLFIPLGFPQLEEAIDRALKQGDGDLMTDAAIYTEGWWFIVGQSSIRVEGTVAKTRGAE